MELLAGMMMRMPSFFGTLFRMIVCFLFIGSLSFLLGEMLPRTNFRYQDFPFRSMKWENGGKFYTRFRIDFWKDHVPDMSQYIQKAFRKKMSGHEFNSEMTLRMVTETCVAEIVHWGLVLLGPIYLVLFSGAWGVFGVIMSLIGNLPFIVIQRYNRPRLVRLYERQKAKEEKKHAAVG